MTQRDSRATSEAVPGTEPGAPPGTVPEAGPETASGTVSAAAPGTLPEAAPGSVSEAVSGTAAAVTEAGPPARVRAANAVRLPEPWASAAVTVVLPTYNEAGNLPVILGALFALPLPGLRVLVVDDNSPDGTGDLAERLAADEYGPDRLSVLHRPGKQGLGRAYVHGMGHALDQGAAYVVQMDADLSHPPEAIPQMLGTLLSTEADVVIGSRYATGGKLAEDWSFRRKALSAWANFYVRVLLHLRVRDVTAGFKLWRRETLHAIDVAGVTSNGYAFQVEMNYRTLRRGLKIVEVPIRFEERRDGQSKMSLAVQLESALMPFKLRRDAARRPSPPNETPGGTTAGAAGDTTNGPSGGTSIGTVSATASPDD
ncbi:glycosyltransferase [Sphaerisporangium album]|uniref:Glycosyltransferase n=1 Tax=Sphaerisporangium album TaxID=509200 RepID=A0A367FQQ9_9ACTN|nr:glycosyltransferase [Sphaerisporangium album]